MEYHVPSTGYCRHIVRCSIDPPPKQFSGRLPTTSQASQKRHRSGTHKRQVPNRNYTLASGEIWTISPSKRLLPLFRVTFRQVLVSQLNGLLGPQESNVRLLGQTDKP
ncbi:hypothetical protein TWF225_011330 [Orbilia oligospora]|uniref:Uncharacterized protein n=1 Tax=Orbilia oligospora TaxID=2813651 RepID=A0A7C8P3U7_ORBOL|nr:hypothetical protein TWF751_003013 [Orbilia oligospora]KAF3169439.1 hypothetical protein TWF225_011330 [Orbilia oligospora]KAF3244953.1 hypothetical protein TWF217_010576 [Orbilia oligospora]KAF3265892.1 hypothetical protein TWF128_011473 [Orbilia oligospora]KAF3290146.1 hypothetical protein TWF132_007149 [Orbilia oligospora]